MLLSFTSRRCRKIGHVGRKPRVARRRAVAPGLRFDTLQMTFDAAVRGLGVALGRRPLVDAELAAGTLVKLWEPEVPCESAYWLVSSKSKRRVPIFAPSAPDDCAAGHPWPAGCRVLNVRI